MIKIESGNDVVEFAHPVSIQYLLFQIRSRHPGKIPDIFDVGKIFSENFLLCFQVTFRSGKDSQDSDSLISKFSDLRGGIFDGIISEIRRRIFTARTVNNDIIGAAVT